MITDMMKHDTPQTTTINYHIPNFDKFADFLHDRLHALLYHYEEMEGKFTLFTNLLDRSEAKIKEGLEEIRYYGLNTQRKILEEYGKNYHLRDKTKDDNWAFLNGHIMPADLPRLATFRLWKDFSEGRLNLDSCYNISYLKDYFKGEKNVFQVQEEAILKDYFDLTHLNEATYISLPIIAFGTIDGVVHIIFNSVDKSKFERPKDVRRIIKYFTDEYEGLLLDWDVAFDNIDRVSEIKIQQLDVDEEYVDRNPILNELKFPQYYKISTSYLEERVKISDNVPKKLLEKQRQIIEQHRENAIITILIDSFAHNISTHSMTTLAWWFKERSDFFDAIIKKDITLLKQKFQNEDQLNPLIIHHKKTKTPLAKELYPFFRFLSEKATFWNAISRQTNFAGQTFNLFTVFWHDFLGNPLYLGTIANTENVNKIHLKISFYKEEISLDNFIVEKIKGRDDKGNLLEGILGTVDLKKLNPKNKTDEDTLESVFIRPGEKFDILKKELEKCETFFPGGIIGKHAFLTIIENEIRNVKHFREDARRLISEKGLTIHISIHQRPVNPNLSVENFELYKIGVWLDHPTILNIDVLSDRHAKLYSDIITEGNYRPKLGGTYQDKICASMLFNNKFGGVDDKKTLRNEWYYPWIKTAISIASESEKENIVDFELSSRKYHSFEDIIKERYLHFTQENKSPTYFKKYFHLWKGGDVHVFEKDKDFSWDNLARYRFIAVPEGREDLKTFLRNKGVIRIIEINSGGLDNLTISNAYNKWLQIWNKGDKRTNFTFTEGSTPVGKILYSFSDILFLNKDSFDELENEYTHLENYSEVANINIKVEHGGQVSFSPGTGNYRSYGVMLRKLFKASKIAVAKNIERQNLWELYESLITSICIFDDRVKGRVSEEKMQKFYAPKLACHFFSEEEAIWEKEKEKGFTQYHFLAIHLSFIENMLDYNGHKYGEKDISRFIEEQILPDFDITKLRDNFRIVITTGRGRSEWWDILKQSKFSEIVTFRPIESILDAIEDAIQINDDIDLKYNLTKVFLGS